ncbi:MAG: ABC transporter permease [Planctomycetes bacterium]|nr:ABC transporter permease [Planctomycetota bacterium]
MLHDLETAAGREFYGLAEEELAGVEVVPLRVRAGDEASCLNLDLPRSPRLLGVRPARLAGRFRFSQGPDALEQPWALLDTRLDPYLGVEVVPAIVDATSLQWTLHKRLGDELELVDGRGRPFRVRFVAALADSVLQGDVLIAEARFEALFPDEAGQRAFLLDAPPERAAVLAERLARALADEGLTLVPTHERLDLLHGVQNTYLTIFQALGGLGLVLGSAGLLALVLRSAVERRGELALMRALGFSKAELRWLFLGEQAGLVWIGLVVGALAGLCVVLPSLDFGALHPLRTLALLLVAVGLSGTGWVWLGATAALRGPMLAALNRE